MEEKKINKFLNIFKDKFTKSKIDDSKLSEYAFSDEELEDINKQNKQKIQELKESFNLNNSKKLSTSEVLSKLSNIPSNNIEEKEIPNIETIEEETPLKSSEETKEEVLEEIKDEIQKQVHEELTKPKNSFVNLDKAYQTLVMNKWKEISQSTIDKDIMDGKDLLNHNYSISYSSDAIKFIQHIRSEYEVVICYLIGFNNEKQGIFDKTIFSDSINDEWKYLSNYIKLLEKIRQNR